MNDSTLLGLYGSKIMSEMRTKETERVKVWKRQVISDSNN